MPTPPKVAVQVSNGIAYVGDNQEHVYALRADTGARIWQTAIEGNTYTDGSLFTLAKGVMYAGSNSLFALRISDGKLLWYFQGGGWPYASTAPLVDGTTVYGNSGENVYALRATDGKQLWHSTQRGTLLAVINGMVYIGGQGTVIALRSNDGKELWTVTERGFFGKESQQLPIVTETETYVVAGTVLYAVQSTSGKLLWQFAEGERISSLKGTSAGQLYISSGRIGSLSDTLTVLRAGDGKPLWHRYQQGQTLSALEIADGTAYADFSGTLYAVRSSDGTLAWHFQE